MGNQTKIFVTIPLMDEAENIPALLHSLKTQTFNNFKVIICVNQPESFCTDPTKRHICQSNQKTLQILKGGQGLDLQLIDRSSPGKGWAGKHFGVGWARKVAMDEAAIQANPEDIIATMDGDTGYEPRYLESISQSFGKHPQVKAISIPYYHKLTGRQDEDLSVLRYEIYMRYYVLNMLRIKNPYAFTAIGSAMACTAGAYRGIRGITPRKSGEDFYFIQKLRKYGDIGVHVYETAFPAARFSGRVFFGTGPAMIKGNAGDWSGYPIYPHTFFDEVKNSFDAFTDLHEKDFEIPMSGFLYEKFGKKLWQELRQNVKNRQNFTKACQHKVDGLRILQFLKWRNRDIPPDNEKFLISYLKYFYPGEVLTAKLMGSGFNFKTAGIDELDGIRNFLFEKETRWRKKIKILR